MSVRNEQCKKVCKILDDVLANRPSERDALIVAVQKAFDALTDDGWILVEDRSPEIDMSYSHSDSYLVWYDGWDIPDIASYSNVNRFWTEHVTDPYWNVAPFCKVIAWRPLPEPYQSKEDTQ